MTWSTPKIGMEPTTSVLELFGPSRPLNSPLRAQAVPVRRSRRLAAQRGLTFIEMAIVLVISGLMLEMVVKGQELIHNARVRDIISQQTDAEQAFLAFRDRFQALPGDYASASTHVNCGPTPCLNGDGNGRVEPGTGGAIHEDILAWQHLSAAGFVTGDYRMLNASVTAPSPDNTPSNLYGGYLQIALDNVWGYSANTQVRHNLKTGNSVPAAVLTEVDRKIDDGRPGSGRFQFSIYAGAGMAPPVGGAPNGCTDADSAAASWNALSGSDNCGAATLLY